MGDTRSLEYSTMTTPLQIAHLGGSGSLKPSISIRDLKIYDYKLSRLQLP